MGKPKTFAITLNKPDAVYFGGETVEGIVTVELEEALSAREVRVQFKGRANVMWTEQRQAGKTTYTVVFCQSEDYFDHTKQLWSEKESSGTGEISRGMYTFPISFKLPEGLPSSYESRVGKVRYMVTATIDRKFRFNHNVKRAFTVINNLDLNSNTGFSVSPREPGNNSKEKRMCCLCCKSDPITASLHIPKRGYVPGEAIIISADIENLSSRTMAKSAVKILQHTAYHATTKTKHEKKKVTELRHPEIPSGKSDHWRGDRLVVPAVPPSMLQGCRIIDIKYVLQLNVDPSGLGLDLKVPVDIIIGSIPLNEAGGDLNSALMPSHSTAAPSSDILYSSPSGAVTSQPASFARPPPPTYSESVFGKVDITEGDDNKDEEEDNSFAPFYTYYNWGFENTTYNK